MTTTHPLAEFTEVHRDRWGRPMIIPLGGGKPKAYTRTSTMCKTLDDQSGLMKWGQRQTVLGLAARPDLMTLARSARDDIKALGRIVTDAMEAAGSSAAANRGTALHAFAEQVDAGHDADIPDEYAGDIAAYVAATASLEVVLQEKFVVCDELEVAGTFDRLYRLPSGTLMVADIKTGSNAARYSNATAMQIALYARSQLYDPATGERSPLPGPVNLDAGLLVELPAGSGTCSIHKLDLTVAWEFAQIARDVREWRRHRPDTLLWSAP